MDVKKALSVFKQIDELEEIEDLLVEHNRQYILSMNALAQVNIDLANLFEEIELAAPFLFLGEVGFGRNAEKYVIAAGYKIKRGDLGDIPFIYYIQCKNFSFGVCNV